jgi:4-alpha-glucanotransferase
LFLVFASNSIPLVLRRVDMLQATKTTRPELAGLHSLARLYGIELEYENALGERCEASADSLVRTLQLLGAPIGGPSEADGALLQWTLKHWQSMLEPVTVAWADQPAGVTVRLPERQSGRRLKATLRLESGETRTWESALEDLPAIQEELVDGTVYQARPLIIRGALPLGYHRLEVEVGGATSDCLLISAPRRSYDPDRGGRRKVWGAFLPLYALRSSRNWGCGDFTDLASLAEWVGSQGGEVVGTLPLLAAFLDSPFEPSPYSPASRLFWNELYIDVEAIPEFAQSETAKALVRGADFSTAVASLRAAPLVDYRQQMRLKRQVLAELATGFFKQPDSERWSEYERFLQLRPDAVDYARFRSVGDKLGASWTDWPVHLQDGLIDEADTDESSRYYHLYVQWVAEEQMRKLSQRMRGVGVSLYLDLPLGVNAASYDVYRNREAFVVGGAGGCPPDAVFRGGQNWGFPPMHPHGIRNQRYKYIINYLRHQLRHAGILRIDHMPVFHRLFWVPDGMDARDGVYVRYPSEELYAVFSLESHRHQAMLVGEDLGTVPPEVPQSMGQHNVHRMFVGQYVVQPDPKEPIPDAPVDSVASLNTHDMPPFAAFLKGDDIRQRQALGLLGDLDPDKELEQRSATVEAIARYLGKDGKPLNPAEVKELTTGCIELLSRSSARTLLLNLEDLWGEEQSQNIPGTSDQFPNWRRKARLSIEQFTRSPEVLNAVAKAARQ